MNQQEKIQPEIVSFQKVEDAVDAFINGEVDELKIIDYLRANRDNITEFCLQVNESYQSGDKTGTIKLATIIEKLL